MQSHKFTNCVLQFSSSSEDEELNNYHQLNLNSNNLPNSSHNKPIPMPRTKHTPANQSIDPALPKSSNCSAYKSRQPFNQRNLIKNQQQVADSTFTPQMIHKQLFVDKPNFVRTGSLDRKLQEVRKLNFSEMKLRLKQQQQQIEQNLLKRNMSKANNQNISNNANEKQNQTDIRSNLKDNEEVLKNSNYLNESSQKSNPLNKPPTPPQHKGPIWESKFYKLASNCINQITSETTNRFTNNDEHWYLSNSSLSHDSTSDDFKNDFLYIDQLPFYKNANHAIIRIDDLNTQAGRLSNVINIKSEERTVEDNDEFNDYDLPPDAYATNKSKEFIVDDENFNRNDQLRQSKFIERQIEPLEKSGYLLCNKNKSFKQRYFVLKNNCIFYYKTQSDVKKNKLKGTIRLNKDVTVIRNENSSSFQIIENKSPSNLIYTLTADSVLNMEDWVRVIKNSLKNISDKSQDKNIDLESWVIRRLNGYSKKFWLVLKERKLYFYKDPSNDQPVFHLDLNEFRVIESALENSRNSLIINDLLGESNKEYVISLENNCKECKENSTPIYLVLNDKKTFNDWLYHLNISTIENLTNLTDFEKIIYKLMSIPTPNDDYTDLDTNPLWEDHLMLHSKESLIQPLTSLDTPTLRAEGIKLFKSIQLFTTTKIDIKSGIEYHCALAQSAFDTCFEHKSLQGEMFCQLIKQISSNDLKIDSKNSYNFIQSCQLLSLAVSVFEPKGKILWLLKQFLRRVASNETEVGRYAIYCQRCLERCLTNGCREAKPSRLEVLAILSRNPYHHSLPFSIPVNFADGNYIVVSFDGLTTIEEFSKQICDQSDLGRIYSNYGLYSDDPIDANKLHYLPWKCKKIGDVISRWETSLKTDNLGKFESKRVIKLVFKKRLFFRSNLKIENDKEKMLFMYQLNNDILNHRIPIANGSDLPIHLTALLLVFENGKMVDDEVIKKGIEKFYPKNLIKEQSQENLLSVMRFLINQMGDLGKKDCTRIYLNCIKKWPIFGCSLFEATILDNKRKVYLAVDEIYFYILDVDLKIIANYFLNKFLKFGHRDSKLIINLLNRSDCGSSSSKEAIRSSFLNSSNSFNASEKLEFHMDKDQLHELILLIADYLNVENATKFDRLTSESNATNSHTSPLEFSLSSEMPNSSLYDIKQLNSLKEDQEYSEIYYSPSYESNNHAIQSQPPVLPLHRCATWEKNLYELCVSNFNQFIECSQQHDLLFNHLKDDAINLNQNILKNRNSISSMISGEYYTNQLNHRDLSNEFSSLNVSQYSLSKSSVTKKSSNMSRCNSNNSSSGFLNEENLILKESLLVLNKKIRWKKRIVLIRNYTIYYFKNESDLSKGKSKGKFKITSKTQLEEEDRTFKLVDNQQPSISITCDNQIKLKQCMTVILSLIEKLNFKNVEALNSTIEGWVSVIQNGICTRRWCKLKEKVLFFYDESDDEASLILNLTEFNVEEAESNDYEFSDWTQSLNMERKREFSISIESSDCLSDNVYLVFIEKKDFDVWFYHLSIAGNKVIDGKSLDKHQEKQDTTFEQIISKLMRIEYEDGLIALESSYLWNESAICSINESISQPLTTLKSNTLYSEALKLYKSVYLFASVEIKLHAIDYHIALAQGSIELCLDYAELQNEFYCQIIKLSNSNNSKKLIRLDQSNQENHLTLQALQLLSIAISIFIPKGKVLWFIKHFLRRQSDEHSNTGRYAIYCTKALERAVQTGNREFKPSRVEILGMLSRNPYHHSLPHSIPAYFLNDKYSVVSFDGSTTIEEFTVRMLEEIGLNSSKKGEFALYCDNPILENRDHYLQVTMKVSDIISQWEQCLRKKLGKFENKRILKLTLKNRLYFKNKNAKTETDKERLFLVYKICDDIRNGKFPINHDLAIQFLALFTQSEYGNLENHLNNHLDRLIEAITSKFYPINLKSKVHSVFLLHDLKSKWMEIKNASSNDCIRVLINCAKKWPLFGCTLFKAQSTKPIKVELTLSKYILPSNTILWIAIDENHISILDFHNYQQIYQFKLNHIVKFGGQQDKFSLVVKKCNDEFDQTANRSTSTRFSPICDVNYERFVFAMNRSQIYEFTLLIRDYLERCLVFTK